MQYKKKRNFGRKRKTYRKRYGRKKTQNITAQNKVFKAKLKLAQNVFTHPTGIIDTIEYAPSLSNMANPELTAYMELYDEFKITGFTVELRPRQNTTSYTAGNIGNTFYSVIDHTDVRPLASAAEALEYSNCRTHKSWRTFKRYAPVKVPKLLLDIQNTPLLRVDPPTWMQTLPQLIAGTNYDNTLVAHLGMKLFFEINNNAQSLVYDEILTLNVSFRNKK